MNIENSVLIVVDMQEFLRNEDTGRISAAKLNEIVHAQNSMISDFRAVGSPIIFLRYILHQPGVYVDRYDDNLLSAVNRVESDCVIEKENDDGFVGTDLEKKIIETGRREIVFVGQRFRGCLGSCARSAVEIFCEGPYKGQGYGVSIETTATLHGGYDDILTWKMAHDLQAKGVRLFSYVPYLKKSKT